MLLYKHNVSIFFYLKKKYLKEWCKMSEQKITEKLSYLTDIITSYDGHEQRIKLRQ